MSRLALDITLLQRMGVIGIILILIYSLYQKKLLSFANTDVSSTKIYLDTSVFAKGNMGWREYQVNHGTPICIESPSIS
jgi:hypothetical protein